MRLRAEGKDVDDFAQKDYIEGFDDSETEASGNALLASNADLTGAGGLGTDLAARFLAALADTAKLSLHVRLIEGENTDHVLEAIFKALGVALAAALNR